MPLKTKLLNTVQYTYSQWELIVKKQQLLETYPNRWFPNDDIKEEYLKRIEKKSHKEIRYLLRHFLLPTAGLFGDEHKLKHLLSLPRQEKARRLDEVEFFRRLL